MSGFRNTKREYNLHKAVAKVDILRDNLYRKRCAADTDL